MKPHDIWGILALLFVLFFAIGVFRNAKGASTVFGTLIGGTNMLGRTLEGR